MSHDIAKSYHPLIMEYRDTAVEKLESLRIINNRTVLTEIPDEFNKVYITGFIEVEKRAPQDGEYLVDYKTGIIDFGGNVEDNSIANVNYYGRGLIMYPAQRIYSLNQDTNVVTNLQEMIDAGEVAIQELSKIGSISERMNHTTDAFLLGNNDWTPLIYSKTGGSVLYKEENNGVSLVGRSTWVKISVRLPVDPESSYYVRAKATKTVGDGTLYIGAISLDENYNELSTDQATSYNYFGALSEIITSGQSRYFEGLISGYNTIAGTYNSKFDPNAKFFDLVIIGNYNSIASVTETVIDWLELYRVQNVLHVKGNSNIYGNESVDGTLTVGGNASMKGINMNNNTLSGVTIINGQNGVIAKSTDEWLRINEDGSHTSGVYFGNSLIRTDGTLHIGNNGATLLANGTTLTYKGNKIGVADGTLYTNLNADMLDGLHESTFMRKSANSNLTFDIVKNGKSNGIIFNGLTDTHSIFVEETANAETTRLVFENFDGGEDHTLFRYKINSTTKDLLKVYSTGVDSYVKFNAKDGFEVTSGATKLNGTLQVVGGSTFDGSVNISGSTSLANVNSTGNIEATGKVWVGKSIGTTPTNTLTIGDSDTGINWISDGNLEFKANNTQVASFSSSTFDIKKNMKARDGVDVTGNITATGTLTIGGNVASSNTVTFDGSTSTGMRVTNSNGYVSITPLNTDWAHVYTDRNKFIFNTPVYSLANIFSSYNSDLYLQRAGATKLQVGNTSSTLSTDLVIDNGVNTKVTIFADDGGEAVLQLIGGDGVGNAQSTGRLFVGQSASYGGGIEYNGDNSPASSGAGADYIALYRVASGSAPQWTARNLYTTNDWEFRGEVKASSFASTGGMTLNGNMTMNGDIIISDGKSIRPATSEGATLGTPDFPFQDVYVGANSLYVDGNKVVSSTATTLEVSTSVDQHLSIFTQGLGTTRVASAKEVILYSGMDLNIQALGDVSTLSDGRIEFKTSNTGQDINFETQSTLGKINFKSLSQLNFDAPNIQFLKLPNVNGTNIQLSTDAIVPSRVTQDANNRFVTDSEKSSWNGKLNRSGGTMTGFITLHADPTSSLHAVTKRYVDAIAQGLSSKHEVRVTTTANITLSGTQTIDGVALVVGDRVLVKDQTDAKLNGIYIVQSGAWTRSTDFDENADILNGAFTFVEEGAKYAHMGFILETDGTVAIGTTPITFTQFSGAGQVESGTGLYKSGNEIGIANTGVSAGTYKSVTVNAQGQVTSGSNPTTLSGYGITDALNVSGGTLTGDLTISKSSSPALRLLSNTNVATGGRIDFLESGNTFEEAGANGFQFTYEGDANYFSIKSTYSSVTEHIRIIRNGDVNIYSTLNLSSGLRVGNSTLTSNSDGSLRVSNTNGYVDISPRNSSYAHFQTDRPLFYFYKDIHVLGYKALTTADEGHGKGIDADTLDTLHATSFMRTDDNTTTSGKLTAKILALSADATDTFNHRVAVYDSGSGVSYGMMLWNDNGSTGDWSTMIYTANQPNRKISFGKINSTNPTQHSHVTEGAYFDADDWKLYTTNQIYVNNNVVWNAGNDGSGSGLDADLIDGKHSTDLMLLDGTQAMTGTLKLNENKLHLGVDEYIYSSNLDTSVAQGGMVLKSGQDVWVNVNANDSGLDSFKVVEGSAMTELLTVNASYMNYKGSAVLTTANEGHGKGIDADTVDGKHATDFVASTTPYISLDTSGSTVYPRMSIVNNPTSDTNGWIRVGVASSGGLIPYTSGQNYLGTSEWKFKEIHSVNFYENGVSLEAKYFRANDKNSVDVRLADGDGRGLRFWDSDNYKIYMSATSHATYGGRLDSTSDYNMYFKMSSGTNRGFAFKNGNSVVAQIDGSGGLHLTGSANVVGKVTANTLESNASIKIGDGRLHSDSVISLLMTSGAAQIIKTGGVGIGYTYSGMNIPLNGLYSKGNIVTDGTLIVNGGRIQVSTSTTSGAINAMYAQLVVDAVDGRIQIKSSEDGSWGSGLTLSTGATHWGVITQTTSAGNKFQIGVETSSTEGSDIGGSSLTKFFTIDKTGNVGIGYEAPSKKLAVNGEAMFSSQVTAGSLQLTGVTIGMGNDSEVLYFNDSNNENRTGFWTNKDGFSIRGDSNLEDNVVLRTGHLNVNQNAYFGGKVGLPKNRAQVVFTAGQKKQTVTHNFGSLSYNVAFGADSFARHIKWSNKQTNTIDIELDDVAPETITVDVILMPY